jgi:hypothetical protein
LQVLKDFHKKKLNQIKWWAWAAVVLPIVSLAGLFFINYIGTETYWDVALTCGATIMFTIAVIWWWWAIYTIAQVTNILGTIADKFKDVGQEIKLIKKDISQPDDQAD